MTLIFSSATIVATVVRLINLRLNCFLAASIGSDLSCEAFKRTIYKPYAYHIASNSSNLISGIATNLNRTVAAINSLLQLITSLVVSIGLFFGLLLINWKIAISAACVFGGLYVFIALRSRKNLKLNSKHIVNLAEKQIKVIQEGLGAIREVILGGNQKFYLDKYSEVDLVYRSLLAQNKFVSAYPRYSLEGVGLVLMSLMGGFLVSQEGTSNTAALSLLGALALGAQRILPALQQVYGSWSIIKGFSADLESVLDLLRQTVREDTYDLQPIAFNEKITLRDIVFSYSIDGNEVLKGANMVINRGDRIGIVGESGSGKSTIIDILIGLLRPTNGTVIVDDIDLYGTCGDDTIERWQSMIAHVPQNIYLSDNSIAENIAFGVPLDEIDHERVREAASQAQIKDYIENSLGGFGSVVGERGVRLKGGQRQRIAIARALYKNAKVLIFDEATSALDINTEIEVMAAIENLSSSLTIILVAHRLSTTKCCNRVFSLKGGSLIEN